MVIRDNDGGDCRGLKAALRGLCEAGGRDDVCLLYTSDAADERSSVDFGGRRIIKKKNTAHPISVATYRSLHMQ